MNDYDLCHDCISGVRFRSTSLLRFAYLSPGWDTFSLQYDVGRPLSVILTSSSMEAYLRIFRSDFDCGGCMLLRLSARMHLSCLRMLMQTLMGHETC